MVELQLAAADVIGEVLAGRSLDAQLRIERTRANALAPGERPSLQDICYGTLRHLGEIDALLDALLDKPLKDGRLRQLLRVAIYQLAHTRAAPHAIVDHAVRACVTLGHVGAKGLVNAVLRNFLRKREPLLQQARATGLGQYSHAPWWIERLRHDYPEHWQSMLLQANSHPPLTLRVNARVQGPDAYVAQLEARGIAARALGAAAVMLEHPVPVERIPGFSDGHVSVQDAAAQHAAVALDAPPGARVLDACAAPGGKTAHILERSDVQLVALDHDRARIERVSANLKRLKLAANLVCADAAQPGAWRDGEPYTHILADVPCSASGVVRRHPDIKWLRRREDIAGFAQRQRAILESLWQALARNGKLLYATCSVFHEENEAQIEGFVARHPDAQRLTLPGPHTNAQLLAGQILPDENHDGFFYALLQKS